MTTFMRILITLLIFLNSKISLAETIQIEFTKNDSYSIEVSHIDIGDRIDWLPKSEGHNVEFLAGPNMDELPPNSQMNQFHSVVFRVPGIYLYGCTPHLNMGMLGLIIVGNDIHNLDQIKKIELSHVATSVLERLSVIAQSDSK